MKKLSLIDRKNISQILLFFVCFGFWLAASAVINPSSNFWASNNLVLCSDGHYWTACPSVEEPVPGSVTITGTGFGSGPNIVLFDSFAANNHLAQVDLNGPEVGSWSEYNTTTAGSTGNAWVWEEDGRKWLASRDPNNLASTDALLSSLQLNLASNATEFRFAFRWRIANGYKFPSASSNNGVENTGSNYKMTWFWDSNDSGDLNGDVVLPTFNQINTAQLTGNAFKPVSTAGGDFYLNYGSLSGTGDNVFSYYQSHNSSVNAYDAVVELYQHTPTYHDIESRSDVNPYFVNSRTDTPDGYNRITFNAWQNSGLSNSLVLLGDFYLATGPNSCAAIITHDQPTLTASADTYFVPFDTWTDTQITYTPRSYEALGYHTVIGSDCSTLVDGVAVP